MFRNDDSSKSHDKKSKPYINYGRTTDLATQNDALHLLIGTNCKFYADERKWFPVSN